MTDTSRVEMAITQIVTTFVATAGAIFVFSFFIPSLTLVDIAVIVTIGIVVGDIVMLMGCDRDSIIMGTWYKYRK